MFKALSEGNATSSASPWSPTRPDRRRRAAPAARSSGSSAATSRSSSPTSRRQDRPLPLGGLVAAALRSHARSSSPAAALDLPQALIRRSTVPSPLRSRSMLPTIAWEGDDIVMVDQRKLPAAEVYVTCKTVQRRRQGDQDHGDSRRAGHRRRAAMGLALGAARSKATGTKQFTDRVSAELRRCWPRRGRRPSTCSGRSSG